MSIITKIELPSGKKMVVLDYKNLQGMLAFVGSYSRKTSMLLRP